ncbi:MAG: hypothetical protein ACRDPY_16610 [Streptosporangiaceae bacterium]
MVASAGWRPLLRDVELNRQTADPAEYGGRVREAYPPSSFGTVFPFRRVFTVAHRPGPRSPGHA